MAHQSTMLPLGTTAPDFTLPHVATGRPYSLADFRDSDAVLVVFLCAHCPYVVHVRPELARIAQEYQVRGLGIVGITSNDVAQYPEDAPAPTAHMAEEAGLKFPVLYDETQEVAHAYSAACTPDFFLFDRERKLVYRGQLDGSRPARGEGRPGVGELNGKDLREAIEAVLAGRPVSADQRPSIGCNIKWKPGNEPRWFGA
jgi:peroxiredoxin